MQQKRAGCVIILSLTFVRHHFCLASFGSALSPVVLSVGGRNENENIVSKQINITARATNFRRNQQNILPPATRTCTFDPFPIFPCRKVEMVANYYLLFAATQNRSKQIKLNVK